MTPNMLGVKKPDKYQYIARALGDQLHHFSANTLKAAVDGCYWIDDPEEFRFLASELAKVPGFHLTRIGRSTKLAQLIRQFRK